MSGGGVVDHHKLEGRHGFFFPHGTHSVEDLHTTLKFGMEVFAHNQTLIAYMRNAIASHTHGRADGYELACRIGKSPNDL